MFSAAGSLSWISCLGTRDRVGQRDQGTRGQVRPRELTLGAAEEAVEALAKPPALGDRRGDGEQREPHRGDAALGAEPSAEGGGTPAAVLRITALAAALLWSVAL